MAHERSRLRPPGPCGRRSLEITIVGAILFGVLWSYAYIGLPPSSPVRFERNNLNYYNQLTDGFLFGRAGFKIDPPAELLALSDPYEPKQRAAAGNVGLHDATYFQGRYYLYFGVAPAVCLSVPFKILTGLHFPQGFTTVVFCSLGYLVSLVLMFRIRDRFFPKTGLRYLILGTVMLGLGNLCLPMLARNSIWEVPISAAYFFSTTGFLLIVKALSGRRQYLYFLVAASAAFGLAVASRPHYIFAVIALTGIWLVWTLLKARRGPLDRTAGTRELLAIVLPVSAIVVALLAYNYGRFGSVFEFGQKYQLTGNRQVDSQLMSLRFLPINFYHYVLSPLQMEGFFPFVDVIRGYQGLRPTDYGGAENPFGILTNLPVSWIGLLAPLLWLYASRRPAMPGALAGIFLGSFLSLAFIVMCFAWSANRYMLDFFPALLFAALVGIFITASITPSAIRLFTFIGLLAAVSYTVVVNLLLPLRNQTFVVYRSLHFAAMSKWFNQPTFLWDEWRKVRYGPVELDVRFPPGRIGKAEPIMVTGVSYKSEYLHVYYPPGQKSVQFYFTRTNYNQVVSQPVRLDFDRLHKIGIEAGSLYPPDGHPFWKGWSEAQMRAKRETLRLTVNGVTYLEQPQEFFPTSKFVRFGENPVSDYTEKRFSGEIDTVQYRPPDPDRVEFQGGSFLRLGVVLPRGASGTKESIVQTGRPGAMDRLSISYERDDRIRFVFAHDGSEPTISPGISVKPGEVQLLEISLGSFYPRPRNRRERELSRLLFVQVNGDTVWRVETPFHPTEEGPQKVGTFPAISNRDSAAFSGRIVSQKPFSYFPATADSPFLVQPYWRELGRAEAFGPARIHFRGPKSPALRPEPMVVTGHTGSEADFLYINYGPVGQAQFGYVHSGSAGGPLTQRAVLDPARTQILEVSMPSMFPDEFDEFFAYRDLDEIAKTKKLGAKIRLNGAPLLNAPVRSYPSRAANITFGVDRLAQAFGPRFSGEIIAIEREQTRPPAGLTSNLGPLEIVLRFAAVPMSETETILATGDGQREDTLSVRLAPGGKVRFVIKTHDGGETLGEPFLIGEKEFKITIQWPGFFPDSIRPASIAVGEWQEKQTTATVSINGIIAVRHVGKILSGDSQPVSFGRCLKGASVFSGQLISIQRLPAAAR